MEGGPADTPISQARSRPRSPLDQVSSRSVGRAVALLAIQLIRKPCGQQTQEPAPPPAHKLGKAELEEYNQLKRSKKSIYGRLLSKGATEKNRLFEARRFARLYDAKQLDWLCNLGQKKGRPLTQLHVRELIRVKAPTARNKLAQKCADQSWSLQRLRSEIACILPGRRYSGAPHEVPKSVLGKLVVTEELLRKLIRWVNVLSAPKNDAKKPPIEQLPKIVQTKLGALKTMAEEVEKLCANKRGQPAKPPLKAERKSRRQSK